MNHQWAHVNLWIQAGVTWFMTGLIWYVQIVHYPLMAYAAGSDYRQFQRQHEARTLDVVIGPVMVELLTALLLIAFPPEPINRIPAILGLVLLALIWLSTFCLQVPSHRLLATGFDPAAHRRMVQTNWIRTVAWTGRSLLMILLLVQANPS